jgi:hypothetical protein
VNRILGIVLAIIWLVCMSALVQRDVLPFWTAQEPPSQAALSGRYQCRLANGAGKQIGMSWVTATNGPQLTTVESLTVLELGRMTGLFRGLNRLAVQTDMTYERSGALSMFKISLHGAPMPIEVVAERYVHDFSCIVRIGENRTSLLLDGRMYERLSESLRPFTHLPNLHVGQTWRIRLLDPLAMLKGDSFPFQEELVRVTGREQIRHQGGVHECFRIESTGTIAWTDNSGRVLRQELAMPLLGKIVLTDEPYDRPAHNAASASFRRIDASAAEAVMDIGGD